MKRHEIERAIEILSSANETPTLIRRLKEIVTDPEGSSEVDLIDRNKYFATILWQEEDIRSALEDRGIEPTDENIELVFDNLGISEMENCEYGWDCIYCAINETFSDEESFNEDI